MEWDSPSRVSSKSVALGNGELPGIDFAQEHPLRILIADDNYINRRVLSLLLQRLGYETKTTENGRDCLDAALRNPCDLLLIDIDMPEMSGIECTQQIREAKLDFPIIAVTATAPEVSREKCFAAGMTGYVSKPVRLEELKQILRDASDTRRKKVEGTSPIVA
jgi:CheY-like chemotaxis protein